jgi:hypothetical protein
MVISVVVETEALLETVAASLIAGVGITGAFSVMIFGAARFADLRRDERPMLAGLTAAVALFGLVVTLGGIVLGIVAMTSK